ncbi:hypothetical protein F8M41_000771 [Gigaspora margarita]|uniref:F-box domain-containing protein n=1 Tax=Gigaspora margarita TaxID=4874 RepID=A0A8H4ESN1_GIGMA|nr:hypothetical protein F8M41_000771 [Gigaspora margarita]
MATKLFMGDMPELMENILNNLNKEFYSLYSCALVSRHWCKMSIPILWQDPFSIGRNSLFISQYFSSLDENEKFVLKEYGINVKFSNTLFNYARFLKVLNIYSLKLKVSIWINFQHATHTSTRFRVIDLLFKLFVESGATLHKLYFDFSDYEINPEIFYSLGRNELFFSRLQDLSLAFGSKSTLYTENATVLLKILAKDVTKLSALELDEFYSDYGPQLLHALICIIKSQEQLKQFSLIGVEFPTESYGIISALASQNNSLQEVIMECCECSTEEFKVLKNCKNFEILRIRNCYSKEILEASLNTLEITSYSIFASNIVQVLKKSGTLLKRLKLISTDEETKEETLLLETLISTDEETKEETLLLETLKSFCPNITYLNISDVGLSTQFLELIGNLQKLQFLTLWYIGYKLDDEPEIHVMQFAKLLPLTLQYLDLRRSDLDSYIDTLLNNCYAPLKFLLIKRLNDEKDVKALVEFCIRKRSLNYMGVSLILDDNTKKEVEGYVTLISCEHIVVNC